MSPYKVLNFRAVTYQLCSTSIGLAIRIGLLTAMLWSYQPTLRNEKNGLITCPGRDRTFGKVSSRTNHQLVNGRILAWLKPSQEFSKIVCNQLPTFVLKYISTPQERLLTNFSSHQMTKDARYCMYDKGFGYAAKAIRATLQQNWI